MIIDFHVHVSDPALGREVAGRNVMGGWGTRDQPPFDPDGPRARQLAPMGDPALMIADMDRLGIDVNVLTATLIGENFEWAEPAQEARLRAASNDNLARWVAGNPERFAAFAALPLKDPKATLAELDRALGNGLTGVNLPAMADGDYLGAPRFHPLWEAIRERDVPVFMHPDGARDPWYLEYSLWNSVGQPVEEARLLASLILEGVLERFAGLRIVISHGGGYVPHYFGRLDRNVTNFPESVRNISRKPSEYLHELYYDTCLYDVEILNALIRRYGAGQIVMGSDYPVGEKDPIGFVRQAEGLDEDGVDRILGGNAASELLRLA